MVWIHRRQNPRRNGCQRSGRLMTSCGQGLSPYCRRPSQERTCEAGRACQTESCLMASFLFSGAAVPGNTFPRSSAPAPPVTCEESAWVREGVFAKLWVVLAEHYDELRGRKWDWQSLDAALGKAPGIVKKGPPTRRSAATPQTVGNPEPRTIS